MTSVKSQKDARKLASQTFRDRGAVLVEDNGAGRTWRFPDDYLVTIRPGDYVGVILNHIKKVQERYGYDDGDNYYAAVNRPGKPHINLDRLVASDHAKERLRLMQRQARVEFREVLHAIRLPERVLYSEPHGSWLWIRDRLAVAVKEVEGTFLITSVLWATQELFDQYPRPA